MKFNSLNCLRKFLLVAGVASTLTACGYRFQGSGTVLPVDVRKIAIQPVDNLTTEPGLSQRLREALRSRFDQYGAIEVVERADQADALLNTKVTDLDTRVRSVQGTTDVAVELDLVLTISAELKRKNGEILWRDDKLKVDQPFANTGELVVAGSSNFAQGSIGKETLTSLNALQVSEGEKEQTLSDLLDETARQIYFEAVAADF